MGKPLGTTIGLTQKGAQNLARGHYLEKTSKINKQLIKKYRFWVGSLGHIEGKTREGEGKWFSQTGVSKNCSC